MVKLINKTGNNKDIMLLKFRNLLNSANAFINYKISLKELYFSLTTWVLLLVGFLALATKFQTTLVIINLILAFFCYFIIVLLTNRIILSGFLTLLLAVLFDYIKLIKWQFLMQELSAADFFMLRLLINNGLLRLIYEYATKEIYLIIILLIVNFVWLWNKSDTLLDANSLGTKNYYALRLVSLTMGVLLSLKIFDLALDKKSYLYSGINLIRQQGKTYPKQVYGPFADILFTLPDIYIEPQKGSEDSEFILSQIPSKTIDSQYPDIIVILNESVFDPSKLDYDFTRDFNFKFFQNNQYTKYSGILNVNTFGGSSWISEYEINTGIPHKSFAGPSYMPFITLAPKTNNSLMHHLNKLGYSSEVIYPVDKNFSLATEAYTQMGMHKITDIYERGFKPASWGNVPDQMIGQMIIEALEQAKGPKYIFASTMLNHGPHSSFFPDHIGCSRKMNDQLCSKLNDYLTRLKATDTDQMNLINQLMQRDRPTIVVNFGDHMPSFEGFSTQLRFNSQIRDYYRTFYNIHANFPIKDYSNYPYLDIHLIAGLVLDMAQLNNDDFYLANSLVRQKCQGSVENCLKHLRHTKLVESYKSLITEQLGF